MDRKAVVLNPTTGVAVAAVPVEEEGVGGKLEIAEEEGAIDDVGFPVEEGMGFLRNLVLSVVFLGPREEGVEEDLWGAHEEGIDELKGVQKRLKKVTGKGGK